MHNKRQLTYKENLHSQQKDGLPEFRAETVRIAMTGIIQSNGPPPQRSAITNVWVVNRVMVRIGVSNR